ncbi:hypothetical protein Tco_0776131, partial [Tanacetum coccineum]
MAGADEFQDYTPPPPPPQTPTQQAPHTVSTIKLPILKKGEYDIWAMKIEHYLIHTDYPIWEVIQKGNGPSLLSQLEIHGAGVSTEDANQKFLRTSSTNDVSTAYGVSTSSGYNSQRENSSSYTVELMYSFFANQSSGPQLDHEDLEQLDESKGNQESKRRDAGNTGYKAKDNGRRPGKQEEPKALVTLDGEGVDWTGHADDEKENFALMAYSNSGSDTEDNQQRALKHKGIIDSRCSRNMTGNKSYLIEYQDYNGGPVAFRGSKCYITGKGKIKTGKLDFKDVCFVKE